MALVKCPYCGGAVSTSAIQCPHCGQPLQQQAVAPMPQPAQEAAQESIQELPAKELSIRQLGKMLMCLFSIVGIILLSVFVGKIKGDEEPSKDFMLFLVGYMFSFVGLYYLTRMFVQNSIQQIIGFIVGFGAIFIEVVLFSSMHQETSRDMSMAIGIIFILSLVCVMWFAGTKNDWSKIFFLTAGALFLAGLSMLIGAGAKHTEMVVFGVFGGIGLLSILIGWEMEITREENNAIVRFIALAETLLILTTIIVGAIMLKRILDTDVDITERYNKLRTTMILLMVSGATSTIFSLVLPRKKFLFYMSVLFLAAAMLMTLGHYCDFKIAASSASDNNYGYYYYAHDIEHELSKQAWNLLLAGMFFFPISILMSYVAEATKGITDKITLKVQ